MFKVGDIVFSRDRFLLVIDREDYDKRNTTSICKCHNSFAMRNVVTNNECWNDDPSMYIKLTDNKLLTILYGAENYV